MIIPPNANGWSYDDSVGNWKLVYAEKIIILYEQTDESIATQSTLFVGTQEECEAERVRLGLPWAADVVIDPDYELIHDEQNILYLSIAGSNVDIAGTSFVGKLQECDAEIARLELKHPHEIEEEP
jgi:hypothetical protein